MLAVILLSVGCSRKLSNFIPYKGIKIRATNALGCTVENGHLFRFKNIEDVNDISGLIRLVDVFPNNMPSCPVFWSGQNELSTSSSIQCFRGVR